MKLKETHKYDDILHLSRPRSGRRVQMTNYDRAAQFSPFAALTGFEETIEESGRLTDSRIELDEMEKARLDQVLRKIGETLSQQPEIQVTYFIYDERKSGGAYITRQGRVRKIDRYCGCLILTDGMAIPMQEIISLQLVEKHGKL